MVTPLTLPSPVDVLAAAERIAGIVHRTPVVTCAALDAATGARLWFKCENLQKVGAFKARGATNAVLSLHPTSVARGVCTHSSGNHAAALAWAAARRGVPAYVVMPRNAPPVKHAAVAGYGARVTWCEPTLAAREETLAAVRRETGAEFVHPYDNLAVIAGQGTAALELLREVPELDAVVAPVGGGGLLSGTLLAARALAGDPPRAVRVFGAEPELADDAFRSLRDGQLQPALPPRTVADGLRTALSQRTFAILRGNDRRGTDRRGDDRGDPGVAGVLTVPEETILQATRLLFERAKLVVEPSGAVPLAALLAHPEVLRGARVGVILSGGNVDLDRLPWQSG